MIGRNDLQSQPIADYSLIIPDVRLKNNIGLHFEEMGLGSCGTHVAAAAPALLNDAVKKGSLSGAFFHMSEDADRIAADRGADAFPHL